MSSGFKGGFNKRRRDEPAQLTSYQYLLTKIVELLDADQEEVEQDLYKSLVKQIKREASTNEDGVVKMLVDCAVQLPTKLPQYSVLVGLLNVESPELVGKVVDNLGSGITTDLKEGGSRVSRLMLRASAALVVTGVVQASSVLSGMRSFVEAAVEVAQTNEGSNSYWQAYSDQLVYTALITLPFGGVELGQASSGALEELFGTVDGYMAKRPHDTTPALRPCFGVLNEEDTLSLSDSGAASFLSRAVQAIKDYAATGEWQVVTIPRVHIGLEAALAEAEKQHQLAAIEVPIEIPVAVTEGASQKMIAALVRTAYPARGILPILEVKHTEEGRPLVDRLIAEDYILDTLAWWEQDRVECAKRLAKSLPLPFAYEPLLCEVLFSQMLKVPSPEFKPIMYGTLMVDLCKLLGLFPRAMSACVRECFARMDVLDPVLRLRLAEWLAYHLSNFEYVWPWARWQHVLEAPLYDSQRHFCIAVMTRMMRLSYWERIKSVLPEEFRPLLPPKPQVNELPSLDDPAINDDPDTLWAAKALAEVRKKASQEELDTWVTDNNLVEVLGGKLAVLGMLARCLLVAGAKSYTHMITAFDRYYGPLKNLADECGKEGELLLVNVVASVWTQNPQRACMTVDRLMTLRLVSPPSVVEWVFSSSGVISLDDELKSGMAWELLFRAVEKTVARVQDAKDDLKDADTTNAEAMEEKLDYLKETEGQQREVMLQVVRCCIDSLPESKEDMDDETAAVQKIVLFNLDSFLRRYLTQIAVIYDDIKSIYENSATPEAVKEAIGVYALSLLD